MNSRLVLALVISSVVCLQSTLAQQSTTGPTPPPHTPLGYKVASASQVVIPGMAPYLWYRGCGPTALGMVVGYWNSNGYPGLITGSSSTQTRGVDSAIASPEHYNDYSLPLDSRPNLLPDKSSLGGAHTSNCIADFMNTSWSSRGNYYGWSYFSDVGRSFTDYVALRVASYVASSKNYGYSSAAWAIYRNEVDQGKPVVLLVDSDGDGSTDHFVTGIGYDQADSTYGVYDTWNSSVHWFHWSQMKSGTSWGIYGFTAFDISENPTIARLSSPANGSTGVVLPVTLSWNAVSGALSYRLQVSTNQTFATTVYDQGGLTGIQAIVNSLANNTTYYWRVSAINAGGQCPYSSVWSFTTVSITNPTGSLQVSAFDAENWGQPGINARVVLYNSSGGQVDQGQANSSSVVTFTNIPAGSGYYYRVYYNRTTAWGEQFWGEKTGITINANQTTYDAHTHNTPYMPNVSVFLSNTNELLPDGAMRPVQPGTRLRVELQIKNPSYDGAQTVSAYGGLYLDRDKSAPYDVNVTSTTQTYVTGTTKTVVFYCDAPSMKGDYYLSVGAFASSSRYYTTLTDASGWHDPAFTVVNSPPSLLWPSDGASGVPVSVGLRWTRPSGATGFHLQVATDSTFGSGIMLNDTTETDTARTISGLQYAKRYFWHVREKNAGGYGSWSQVWSFRTLDVDPAIPKLIAPAPMVAGLDTPVTVRWTRPAGATSFHLQVGGDSLFTSGLILHDYPTIDSFAVLHSLSFLTSYWWRVNAYCAATGVSAYSQAWKFSTGLPLPGVVTLVEPAQNAVVNADTLRLRWRSTGPFVDRYWLEYSIDSAFTMKGIDSLLVDTTTVIRNMEKNREYYWRARAHNLIGWGEYSSRRQFLRSLTAVNALPHGVPNDWILMQNYPNPFNPSTRIAYGLAGNVHVKLTVLNALGQEVATLLSGIQEAGYHEVMFDASGLSSGVYFYRIQAGGFVDTKRLLLLR